MDLPLTSIIFLFLVGLTAGFVDTIAGGGGILTIPALFAVGLPPHLALGTNKLQSSFGSLTGSLRYRSAGLASFREGALGILFTFIGAAAGTIAVQAFHSGLLQLIIPFLLGAIFLYTLFSPRLGDEDARRRLGPAAFYPLFGLGLGFYDGFFGPGTGSFWTIAFVLLLGFNLKKATGYTKVMNFTSNIASFLFFLLGGNINWGIGLLMGAGQILGALAGSHFVITRATKWIRVIFLVMVGATIARLFYVKLFP